MKKHNAPENMTDKDYTFLKLNESQNTSIKNPGDHAGARKTVELFKEVFGSYKKATLIPALKNIYAKDAFLNDRIHMIEGLSNIENYFTSTFSKIDEGAFVVYDISYGAQDVYIRWNMILKMKGRADEYQFLGMSQLRFNDEGKVIFHFDYWDYAEILEIIPIIGKVVKTIRSKS
jgi:hypothetical protein